MARILIVASLASSLVRFRGHLIRSFLRAGHSVRALAPEPDKQTVEELASLGVAIVATPLSRASLNPFSDLAYIKHLTRVLRSQRPDLVLAYTHKPVIYSGIACRRERIRHFGLISGLGYGFGQESLRQRLLTPVLTTLFKTGLHSSERVIFQNRDDLELFVQRGIVARERVSLVHGSGVDAGRFSPQPLPPTLTFLLMARLIPEKGIREYVAAAREVRKSVQGARFLLAGWVEPRRGAIRATEVAEWQQEGVIEYLGVLDDVRPAIASASVYVLPSYYREGVPRSVLEAMSMSRAIITTDMPGCRETVRGGRNGLLIKPRDPLDLARAMLNLAKNPEAVLRMGAESRKLIERTFTVEQVNAQMLAAMGLAS